MFWNRQKRPSATKDPLDTVVMRWSDTEVLTLRELLNGGITILGASGSGKTSSSGLRIAKGVVGYPNSGGLILAAKPEDRAMWMAIFEAAGRRKDLCIFEVAGKARFNFIDYEMRHGGHTRNITRCIMTIGETLRHADGGGGEEGQFWKSQQERMLYCAVEIVKIATGTVSGPTLQQFISTAAYDPASILEPHWQAAFHHQCIKKAYDKEKNAVETHDYELAKDYWLGEFPNMADKTRSSILAGVMGILHVYNTGIVRELVSTTTTDTPDDMLNGKWVLVDMPPAEYGELSNFVYAGWKFLTQRAVLRRHAKPGDPIHVIWCDEYQQCINHFDAHYLAQCRSHLGCMVCLSQSLHSYYGALKGQNGKHQVNALMTNFHHKLFHALGDVDSAEYASGLVGKSLQTFVGGSSDTGQGLFEAISGDARSSSSFNEHYEAILQPNVFMAGLRTGGVANDLMCDAILVRSGKPFSNGQNWLKVSFSQKG